MQPEMTMLQDLPAGCLGNILCSLQSSKDRNACSEVCQAWKLVDDQTRDTFSISLSRYHKRPPTPAVLTRLFQRYQNLTSLAVAYMELSAEYLTTLASGCQRLSELRMRMCNGTGLDTTGLQLPALTSLHLTRLPDLSTAGLNNLTQSSRALKTLYVEGCPLLTDQSFSGLRTHCPTLESLMLDRIYGVTGEGIAEGCPSLTYLRCSSGKIDGRGLEAICKGCPGLTGQCLQTSGLHLSVDYEALGLCTRLQKLDLIHPVALRDSAVAVILNGCKELETLQVLNWDSQDLSTAVFPSHQKLTCLELDNSTGLTAQQLRSFVKDLFPALQVLGIRNARAVNWRFDDMKDELSRFKPSLRIPEINEGATPRTLSLV